MTEAQKEILIAKMLDDPSSLSVEEMDAIARDEELRDIYAMSAQVSGACAPKPEIDMVEEWVRFRRRMRQRPSRWRWVMRVAAIFLGVTFVGGVAVKMIDNTFTPDNTPMIVKVHRPSEAKKYSVPGLTALTAMCRQPKMAPAAAQPKAADVPKPLVAKARTKTPEVKAQPEAQMAEVDIEEYLRIQQAGIENDLAMQNAEIYEDAYDAILLTLDLPPQDIEAIDENIRKVTMQ